MDRNTASNDAGALRRQARQHRHEALATEIVHALRDTRLAAEEQHAEKLADPLQELLASR